jgi:DNA-binding LytR/AlgR family response regulator
LKNFTFVIIDDNHNNGLKTRAVAGSFQNLTFLASASSYDEGIDCVLEHVPDIVFLEIDPQDKDSNLSLHLINELHRYLTVVPKIIVTTKNDSLCLNAFKYGVFDYFIHPMETKELRKTLFRLDKELGNKSVSFPSQIKSDATEVPVIEDVISSNEENQETLEIDLVLDEVIENEFVEDVLESQNPITDDKEVTFLQTQNTPKKPLIICVKSYGDYRYIEAKDICYLQADNNSTDIHLNSGEMITAFKTLKHFEGVMTYPFVRIHNSYIANVDYISRIHTGNAVCHIKNTTTKLPFSKSYKENVDAIITTIASGNYLEI